MERLDPAECGDGVHAGEREVEHHHIGMLLGRGSEGRLGIRVATDDIEAGQPVD